MADLISIIMIFIFGFFTVKKLILPRIMAKRAAKNGVVISSAPIPDGMQEAIAKTNRPLTGFDVKLVEYSESKEAMICDIRAAAEDMLLKASLSGRDVKLGMVDVAVALVLYVTYTV